MQPQPITLDAVLVIEDDPGVRRRISRLVAAVAEPEARIVDVDCLAAARSCLRERPFALALVDVQLPDGSGIDLIAWMQRHAPATQAVIVSAWAEEETILAGVRAGAVGYLLKERDDAEILMSLKSLRSGGAPIDPMIARRILALWPAATKAPAAALSREIGKDVYLSEREHEILGLVAQGFSNREMAELLSLSRLTIECHTKNIYRKLAVGSRTAAVFEARAMGLLP
nr:response regulator transcription factor [Pseudoxanthomonas sp.]